MRSILAIMPAFSNFLARFKSRSSCLSRSERSFSTLRASCTAKYFCTSIASSSSRVLSRPACACLSAASLAPCLALIAPPVYKGHIKSTEARGPEISSSMSILNLLLPSAPPNPAMPGMWLKEAPMPDKGLSKAILMSLRPSTCCALREILGPESDRDSLTRLRLCSTSASLILSMSALSCIITRACSKLTPAAIAELRPQKMEQMEATNKTFRMACAYKTPRSIVVDQLILSAADFPSSALTKPRRYASLASIVGVDVSIFSFVAPIMRMFLLFCMSSIKRIGSK